MYTKTALFLEELIDNRLNPILVRELRQMVRSRFVVTMLNLYIGILVVVCLGMVAFTTVSQSESTGANLFNVLSTIMGAACFFVVVIYTGTVTASERINADLMFSSALKPWQIVWGKFLSGLVLSLLLLSAVFPFFTLAYLLRGLDLVTFLSTVYGIFLLIHTVNAFVIYISSTVRTTTQSIFIGLGAFFLFFPLLQMMYASIFFFGFGPFSGFSMADWTFYLTMTLISLSIIVFFLIAAIVVISPPSSNRMVPMRVYVSFWTALSLLYLLAIYYLYPYAGHLNDTIWGWSYFQAGLLLVSLPFIASERDHWSFRIRNTIPRVALFRLIVFPFYTGVACGFLWWLLYAGFVVLVFITMTEIPTHRAFYGVLNFCCVFLFAFDYFFTAAVLRTTILSKRVTPVRTWTIAAILFAILSLGSALLYSFFAMNTPGLSFLEGYDVSILSLFNPVMLATNDATNHGLALQSFGAIAWAVVLVLFSFPWFLYRFAQFSPDSTDDERQILDAISKGRSPFEKNPDPLAEAQETDNCN